MAVEVATRAALPAEPWPAEKELALVLSSVDMVATGGARRVTHLGLHHVPQILATCQAAGRRHGIVVRANLSAAPPRCDITVEPGA